MTKKIAIIGAGFSGLATAWYLSSHYSVTVIDSVGLTEGTSGMASGLLHPFAGTHSKLNWRGFEGYQTTLELLDVASRAFDKPVFCQNKGILRLAQTPEQVSDYQACATHYPQEVIWLNEHETEEKVPGVAHGPGIWIKKGLAVYSDLYLQGLWKACCDRGVTMERKYVTNLSHLNQYEAIIVAAGAQTGHFPELSALRLTALKGQLLKLKWPKNLPPLKCILNSAVYLLMTETNEECIVGGTFERHYSTMHQQIEVAKQELLPKLEALFPALVNAEIIECKVGFRSVAPNHLPLIKKIDSKTWVMAGMGSKGLLYHALMAKELSLEVVSCI